MNASNKFRDDKHVVLVAVKQNPESYEFSSDRLQNDLEILNTIKHQNLDNKENWYLKAMKNLDILLEQEFLEKNTPIPLGLNKR